MLSELLSKIRYALGLRSSIDGDLEQEIAFHIETRAEELQREGLAKADALAQARREFGSAARIEEDSRAAWQFAWLERLVFDVRYSLRTLRRSPLFTTIAILSLALGIGANTAVFTLLDQLMLRMLPVAEPEQLVMIWPTEPHMGSSNGDRAVSYPMYQDFERKAVAFDSIFCRLGTTLSISLDGGAERVSVELVSGNYFQALRARPAIGRLFSPAADDRIYRGHPNVVLSYRYWVNRFKGDPAVVGRKVLLNNYPMEIVGVAPAGFTGIEPLKGPEIWVPIQMKPVMTPGWDDMGERRSQWVQVFGRMKPGYTVASARASLQPLFHQILEQELQEPLMNRMPAYHRNRFMKRVARVEPAAAGYSVLRERFSTALIVLMAMAALILLVACSNVASLLIARAVARQKEIAVRLSIGAGRRALIRQLLIESVLLSMAGAAMALALSVAATRGLLSVLPQGENPVPLRAEPDLRILLFSSAVALATALLFGLVPALQATRLDLWSTLKDVVGAVVGGGSSTRLRKMLVAAQVALSFVLLVGAGLFARTLGNLKAAPTGFEGISNLVTFQLDAPAAGYSLARIRTVYGDVLRELRATPGVKSAAFARLPLLQGWGWDSRMQVEGHQAREDEDMQAYMNWVSPGYWKAMGIPLLEGRDFDERDRADSEEEAMRTSVAIVNRNFARHFFGNQSPIGRHLGWADGALYIRIVGVVENSLFEGPRVGMRRQVFVPFLETGDPTTASFYIRTDRDTASMLPVIRKVVSRVDRTLPAFGMKTLEGQLDETLSAERLIAVLSTVFGLLATLLAALGLYGVMAFAVARRTKEIGLRMALGAPQGSVLWLVLREMLMLLGAGLAVGIPCALLLSRYVSSQLFGVPPTDLWTAGAAVAVLGGVAAVASFVPARRASTIDPMTALHYE